MKAKKIHFLLPLALVTVVLFIVSASFENDKKAVPDAKATTVIADAAPTDNCIKWHPGHYIFIAHARTYDALWTNDLIRKNFLGLQMKFDWGPLENQKDAYDFSDIDNALAYIQKMNTQYGTTKRLVIQMGDKIFNGGDTYSGPAYLSFGQDSRYEGGYFQADEKGSWAVKTWVPSVNERWQKLITALGNKYDSNPLIEAIVFSETILHKGTKDGGDPRVSYHGLLAQSGYDEGAYVDAIKQNLAIAKKAFPHTVILQYMNRFTSNNGRPDLSSEQLIDDLGNYLAQIGVGSGGPDLQAPGKEGPFHSEAFPMFYAKANQIPLGVAAQIPEYREESYTAKKLFDFGVGGSADNSYPDNQALHLNYIFWTKDDNPEAVVQFTRDVVPYVDAQNARINSKFPSTLAAVASPCTQ
jgi:hypothetical protein